MTKREAAIVGAYTGVVVGSFDDIQKYIEELVGRPVWTHELASEQFFDEIHQLAKPDFMALQVTD